MYIDIHIKCKIGSFLKICRPIWNAHLEAAWVDTNKKFLVDMDVVPDQNGCHAKMV